MTFGSREKEKGEPENKPGAGILIACCGVKGKRRGKKERGPSTFLGKKCYPFFLCEDGVAYA